MPLYKQKSFRSTSSITTFNADSTAVSNDDVPDELNIFFRNEAFFLPDGKTWDDLSDGEKKIARDRYRFDPMRPGMNQTLSGFGGMI